MICFGRLTVSKVKDMLCAEETTRNGVFVAQTIDDGVNRRGQRALLLSVCIAVFSDGEDVCL